MVLTTGVMLFTGRRYQYIRLNGFARDLADIVRGLAGSDACRLQI